MEDRRDKINRRNFLKTIGAAGVGSVLASGELTADVKKEQKPKLPQISKRELGKTGVKVSELSLGTMFNVLENQIVLRKCLDWGITYWDTAHVYNGGNSELGIGEFLTKNPEVRKKLFIVSKASGARTVEEVENRLQESLKRMKTDYVDLFYGIHVLKDPAQLTDELRKWAEGAKKRKVIRFFGFSIHGNMAPGLMAASKLDWIDAIMTKYNFRHLQDNAMQDAIEACYKAGIGLTAMKVVAKKIETEDDKKQLAPFIEKGYTAAEAKIKAVLMDKRISSVAVRMKNAGQLTSNAAAVADKKKLSKADMEILRQYAQDTCSGYCAGCSNICEQAVPEVPYVSDIMRYLTYYNSYDDRQEARRLFAEIPAHVRNRLLRTDYGTAEARCPQRIPIGKFIAEAVEKLA